MNIRRLLPVLALSGLVLLPLSGCATYDDRATHARCEEPAWVKDLPPEAARRESRCQDKVEVWNSEGRDKDKVEVWNSEGRDKDSKPLDFGGKNKDN